MAKFGVDPHATNPRWNPEIASKQFDAHVKNIIDKYHTASPDLVKGGSEWYERAHEEAKKVGSGDVTRGAGVIAALSPLSGWSRNVAEAHELRKTGNVASALLPENVVKAQRIMAGEHPDKVLGGNKVRSFYANIHNPSDTSPVTVDRHAHDIAMGLPFVGMARESEPRGSSATMSPELGLGAKGRYNHFVDSYRTAADHLDIAIPNRVQAVTWVAHRGTIE